MDHDAFQMKLMDYIDGSLSEREEAEIREHLKSCRSCREAVQLHGLMGKAVEELGDDFFTPHPPTEDIVRYAAGDSDLSLRESQLIAEHVKTCHECRDSIKMLRQADAPRMFRLPRSFSRVAGAAVPYAAAAVLLLLIYPAYLGIVQMTGGYRISTPPADWGGPAPLLVLDTAQRSVDSLPTVILVDGQPGLTIYVRWEALGIGDFRTRENLKIVIQSKPDNTVKWDITARIEELYRQDIEGMSLMVPVHLLSSGWYELTVTRTEDQQSLFVSGFIIK